MRSRRQGSRFALVFALVAFATGCEDDCAKAWDHMKEVSKKEFDELPPSMRPDAETLEKIQADDAPKRANFIAACKQKKVDAGCVLGAKKTADYLGCFAKTPKGAE